MITEPLHALRKIFVEAGHEMWLVGGACRDHLRGITPKDIDLATSATPEEQIAIYTTNDIRFIPTGMQHGTVTVLLDDAYEITSLRTESQHDGRHAAVEYTRDVAEDLGRRDLTINAIAMTFDGEFIDPFGGRDDLVSSRVRFVGNAEERMREDYLRILRFFRFHARIARDGEIDADAKRAIIETRDGLRGISSERIWMEMSKIISGPAASNTVAAMRDLGIMDIISMPSGKTEVFDVAARKGVGNPATLMGLYAPADEIEALAKRWKWANNDRERATFIASVVEASVTSAKRWLVDGIPREWVMDAVRFHDGDEEIGEWVVPTMPVSGRDLIAAGVVTGPAMGQILATMRERWIESDYTMSRDDLLGAVR